MSCISKYPPGYSEQNAKIWEHWLKFLLTGIYALLGPREDWQFASCSSITQAKLIQIPGIHGLAASWQDASLSRQLTIDSLSH